MVLQLSRQFGNALPSAVLAEDVGVLRMLELAALGRVEEDTQ